MKEAFVDLNKLQVRGWGNIVTSSELVSVGLRQANHRQVHGDTQLR